jgi:hypothetical protein
MAKQIKVSKLTLTTTDGKTIELAMDEAKELHSQLEQLFGEKVRYVPSQPVVIPWEYRPWQPYWRSPIYGDTTITMNTSSGMSCSYSATVE